MTVIPVNVNYHNVLLVVVELIVRNLMSPLILVAVMDVGNVYFQPKVNVWDSIHHGVVKIVKGTASIDVILAVFLLHLAVPVKNLI